MIRKYFNLTPKGEELMKLIEKEINKSNTNLTTETKHTKQKSKK